MARYYVPALMAQAVGDALAGPVAGAAKGALLAPEVQGAYQDIRLREAEAPLRLAALRQRIAAEQQQLAEQQATGPLRQQFMQAEIERMRRPEILQNQWGAYAYGPQGLKEIPLPKPQFDTSTPGWIKRTDPSGLTTWERSSITPEQEAQAREELKQIGPQDIGKMLIWSNKYPQLSGGVEKYMEAYRKAQNDAAMNRYRERVAGALERRASADVLRAQRPPAAAMPRWSQTQTAAKPMTPLEAQRYQSDVDQAVRMLSADPDFATPGRLTKSGLPKDKIVSRLVSEMLGGNVEFDVSWDPAAQAMPGTPGGGMLRSAPAGRFVIRAGRHAPQVLERTSGVGLPPGSEPADSGPDDTALLELLRAGGGRAPQD